MLLAFRYAFAVEKRCTAVQNAFSENGFEINSLTPALSASARSSSSIKPEMITTGKSGRVSRTNLAKSMPESEGML